MNLPLLPHRVETTLERDGTLTLEHLPFPAGQPVEVIILPRVGGAGAAGTLYGTPVRYDRPFDSAVDDEWAALT